MTIPLHPDQALLVTIDAPASIRVRASLLVERPGAPGDAVLAVDGMQQVQAMLFPQQFAGMLRLVVRCGITALQAGSFPLSVTLTQSGRVIASRRMELRALAPGDTSGDVHFDFASHAARSTTLSTPILLSSDTPSQVDRSYPVWYATNRRPVDPGDPARGFTGERDDRVHYGACQVFIPRSHQLGSIGSSWWRRLITGNDDRLRLLGIAPCPAGQYWQLLAEQLRMTDPAERHALVFLHGFNVTFSQAAVRAAQIGCDLGIRDGAMAFFSWPSRGRLSLPGYLADTASIDTSEKAIGNYLVDFARFSGATTIHIIAHSMGNRGMLRAVAGIAADARRRSGARFGQFLLAAADVDSEKFRELCAAYTQLGQRTTLYVSSRDHAVEASRWLHDYPRAGLTPPVTVATGIDTINVTQTDLTMLGHGYVADSRDVLNDMHRLIRHNTPPSQRFALARDPGGQYWHLSG